MTITTFLAATPRTKAQLARATGLPTRLVEEAIHAARLEGTPILSDGRGYWLAVTSQEAAECAAALRRRAITQLVTSRALRAAARRMAAAELQFEQQTMFGDAA